MRCGAYREGQIERNEVVRKEARPPERRDEREPEEGGTAPQDQEDYDDDTHISMVARTEDIGNSSGHNEHEGCDQPVRRIEEHPRCIDSQCREHGVDSRYIEHVCPFRR